MMVSTFNISALVVRFLLCLNGSAVVASTDLASGTCTMATGLTG